jgi:hypothetical protein
LDHPLFAENADLPEVEMPSEDEVVSSHLPAHELSDVELSRNISYYSSLEAYCRQEAGKWKRTEARVTQEVTQKEAEKYLEYFDEPHPMRDKPKTVPYVNSQVTTDAEVVQLRRRLAKSKGEIQQWNGNAEAYAIKKMDYLSERKHRRESTFNDPERMSERIPG